jgi:acyl-CoA thioester hydrolase
MIAHETCFRVRYGETDQMGVVYHGTLAVYFENGRTELIRSLGITYADMEREGVLMPVTELYCRYLRPLHYDDEITVRCTVREMPVQRMTVHTEVLNSKGKLAVSGKVTLAFMDPVSRKGIEAPAFLRELLAKHWQEAPC